MVRYDFNILAVYLSFRTPIGGKLPLPPSGGATAFTPIRIEDFPKSNDSRSLVVLFGLVRSRCYTGPDFAPVSATSLSPYSACHARVTCRNRPAMWRVCVRVTSEACRSRAESHGQASICTTTTTTAQRRRGTLHRITSVVFARLMAFSQVQFVSLYGTC